MRGTACRVYSVKMKLRPERTKGYYPDVFLRCDERVPLASIDLELSMGSIYEDVEWGRKPAGVGGG